MKNVSIIILLFVLTILAGCGSVDNQLLQNRLEKVTHDLFEFGKPQLRCHAMEIHALIDNVQSRKDILAGLSDPIPAVRMAAAIAAGDSKDTATMARLDEMKVDKNPKVRLAVGYALERMGDSRFEKWFDSALLSDNSEWACTACMLIGKLGNEDHRAGSRDKLWAVLKKFNQSPAVKLQAAEALARLGDKTIMEKLSSYAVSGFADDRMVVIQALKLLGTPQALGQLDALCTDPQIEVQLVAISAYAVYNNSKYLSIVRKAVKHNSVDGQGATERVRALALIALGQIGTAADKKTLYKAMDSEEPIIRAAAAFGAIKYLKRPLH
ncbi:MAG: HEAT repeat domain-containing protein [Phycisphaerae bacterium]|nr:HEAT repeat domain-containing protein [Phycisphaerae bacterium]